MSDPSPPLSRMEQIQVLLAEYNTLRTEIIQKSSSAFQVYGVAGSAAVAIFLIGAAYSPKIAFMLFIIFPLPIWVIYRNVEFDIHDLAVRIRELEDRINEVAGFKLLEWEAKYGGRGQIRSGDARRTFLALF